MRFPFDAPPRQAASLPFPPPKPSRAPKPKKLRPNKCRLVCRPLPFPSLPFRSGQALSVRCQPPHHTPHGGHGTTSNPVRPCRINLRSRLRLPFSCSSPSFPTPPSPLPSPTVPAFDFRHSLSAGREAGQGAVQLQALTIDTTPLSHSRDVDSTSLPCSWSIHLPNQRFTVSIYHHHLGCSIISLPSIIPRTISTILDGLSFSSISTNSSIKP